MSNPKFSRMSRTSPAPSVLSPMIDSPSNLSVLTAPACVALSLRCVANSNASSLNGTVTLSPRPPDCRKAFTSSAKRPGRPRIVPYSTSSPSARANIVWMRGDWLCATGLPMTA
jgi:hypothetical protein